MHSRIIRLIKINGVLLIIFSVNQSIVWTQMVGGVTGLRNFWSQKYSILWISVYLVITECFRKYDSQNVAKLYQRCAIPQLSFLCSRIFVTSNNNVNSTYCSIYKHETESGSIFISFNRVCATFGWMKLGFGDWIQNCHSVLSCNW